MLIMLGLASGGVPSVAPSWPSTKAFIVPMVLGLATALAWRGGVMHLFLSVAALV